MFKKEKIFFTFFLNLLLVLAFSLVLVHVERFLQEEKQQFHFEKLQKDSFEKTEEYFQSIANLIEKVSQEYSRVCEDEFVYLMRRELFKVAGGVELGVVDRRDDHAIVACDSWGNRIEQKVDIVPFYEELKLAGPFDIKSLSEPIYIIKKIFSHQEYNVVVKKSAVDHFFSENSGLALDIKDPLENSGSDLYENSNVIQNVAYLSRPLVPSKEYSFYFYPLILLFFVISVFLITPRVVLSIQAFFLKRRIKDNYFYNVYQPIVDTKDNKIFSIEIFLRSKSSQGAGELAKMIKDYNLYIEHTIFQIQEMARSFSEEFLRTHSFQVNVSSKHIESDQFITGVSKLPETIRLGLILEITEDENLMRNRTKIKKNMDYLRALGCRFAVDDFGMEYSGLSYISEYDFEIIKTDKLFVESNFKNNAIMRSIQTLSEELEIDCIAEGVEIEADCQRLQDMGIYLHQGWHHNKPMSAQAVLDYELMLSSDSSERPS
ncbi:EAL domain-containing protein [Marinomonas epiphytica]